MSRREVAEGRGRHAWYLLWAHFPFQENVVYVPEAERSLLEQKVIATLTGLEKKEYAVFCSQAHLYAAERHTPSGDFFPGLPRLEEVTQEYPASLNTLSKYSQRAKKKNDIVPSLVAGISFVAGAIVVGAAAEYAAQIKAFENFAQFVSIPQLVVYHERVACALGGVIAGVAGFGVSSWATQELERKLFLEHEVLKSRIYTDFTGKVELCLTKHRV